MEKKEKNINGKRNLYFNRNVEMIRKQFIT